MGYVIFFILCIFGTVGGFFCGRSSTKKHKNQSLPLPKLPHNNGNKIYEDNGIYMEMVNLQEETKSGAIAAK